MFRRLDDFWHSYDHETQGTQKILEALTDASLSQKVSAGHRTLGGLAWHLVTTIPEMMNRTGLGIDGPALAAAPPASAREIAEAYRNVSERLAGRIRSQWTDADLEKKDNMYGEEWARGATLAALLAHQTHHRGQMTVLTRQAGLPVPGIYGPAKEEWAAFGMEPPAS